MADTKETMWSKTGIERDSVARRRTNTSMTTANITAAELEKGVTIEALESLNVPVYRYGTQVTIHGILPDIAAGAMPAGYKSVLKNGNGTVGVRYVGIDGTKKRLLCSVAGLYSGRLRSHIDSRGMTASRSFGAAEEARSLYDSLDLSSFYGTACVFKYVCGFTFSIRYAVEVTIDAIPADRLWDCARTLFACPSESECMARGEAKRQANEAYYAKREVKWQAEVAAERAKEAQVALNHELACQEWLKTANIRKRKITTLPLASGKSFLLVCNTADGPRLNRVYLRKVFANLCYAASRNIEAATAPKGTKFHQLEQPKIATWEAKAAAGLVFAV